VLIARLRTKAKMFTVFSRFADNARITRGVAAIFNIVSQVVCIDAFSNRSMGFVVSNLCAHSTIKGIEIPKPVSVIIGVYVFYNSSFDTIKIIQSILM
jgi:hypothetical protein